MQKVADSGIGWEWWMWFFPSFWKVFLVCPGLLPIEDFEFLVLNINVDPQGWSSLRRTEMAVCEVAPFALPCMVRRGPQLPCLPCSYVQQDKVSLSQSLVIIYFQHGRECLVHECSSNIAANECGRLLNMDQEVFPQFAASSVAKKVHNTFPFIRCTNCSLVNLPYRNV